MKSNPYKLLEEKMITYQQLSKVVVNDCDESFLRLDKKEISNGYLPQRLDMVDQFGPSVIVRESLREKLLKAQADLQKNRPNLELYVTYGYRCLEIQTSRFLTQLKTTLTKFYENPIDLYEEVHRFVAVPTVCGHPTGGAIDVVLRDVKTGEFVDCGSEIYNYDTKDSYVFSPAINQEQKKNRKLLRDCLLNVGFAPFDGEWWHFSYGDVEWAFYYSKDSAIYEQKSSSFVSKSLKV